MINIMITLNVLNEHQGFMLCYRTGKWKRQGIQKLMEYTATKSKLSESFWL